MSQSSIPADTYTRCGWALSSPLMTTYHDLEWGTPLHDDRALFEFLILEGAQAGLSWDTILRKRDAYRAAFDNFVPGCVAAYGEEKVSSLLANPGIVRNRRKILSAVQNAREFMNIQREFGSFDAYIWAFIQGEPVVNHWQQMSEIPAKTELSEKISRDMIRRGFSFVGPTIIYAFMQATGMVNDHLESCFRRRA